MISCEAPATTGLCCSECGHTGDSRMQSTSGHTIGPPAEREYPVEPVGVETIKPSALYRATSSSATDALTVISLSVTRAADDDVV